MIHLFDPNTFIGKYWCDRCNNWVNCMFLLHIYEEEKEYAWIIQCVKFNCWWSVYLFYANEDNIKTPN